MKILENLHWFPRWVSHLGCIKGCLHYLGREVSDAWLFGVTGHAFILNINGNLCPSGPTDWDTGRFIELTGNLGCRLDGVSGWKGEQDLAELQERAWDFVRAAIDRDLPCYGWEMDVPEFYVIYGADETGYYVSGPGCDEGKGPVDRHALGDTGIGVVEVRSLAPAPPADDRKSIRESLEFAVDFAQGSRKWSDGWRGIPAFEVWHRVVEIGYAPEYGLAFNAAVWSECRRFAVEFLQEARRRLAASDLDPLWDRAIADYETVGRNLRQVQETYPFEPQLTMDQIGQDERSRAAAQALADAREAEATGLETLASITQRLTLRD
jgi:hypothetical protein